MDELITHTHYDSTGSVIKFIKKGGNGATYLVREGTSYCVLKTPIYRGELSAEQMEKEFENMKKEGLFMKKYECNAFVSVFKIGGVDVDLEAGESPYILMDYIPGISLHDYLECLRKGDGVYSYQMTLLQKYKIIFGIAHGLSILHKRHVSHRDVKPGNIFLDQDLNPHLGDFGEITENTSTDHIHGTTNFLPPEAFQAKDVRIPCGPPYDVYEFGCTLFQIITYEWPFSNVDSTKVDVLREYTSKGKRDMRFEQGNPEGNKIEVEDMPFYELVKQCWKANPKERPTAEEVLNMNIFPEEERKISDRFVSSHSFSSKKKCIFQPVVITKRKSMFSLGPQRAASFKQIIRI